jgi:hypothetical protein
MSRSVGFTYAITGTVIAASVLAVTAVTVGLGPTGTSARAGAREGAVTESVATAQAILPAGTLQPGEQVVSAEVVQTPSGPVHYVTVETAVATRRSGDDDDHEGREHESREHEEREHTSRTRRESR